jgi:hypothetical protein
VSRKFVNRQTRKAASREDDTFTCAAPVDEAMFQLWIGKTWLRQVALMLTPICRSAYRGVVEFMRDLLGGYYRSIQRVENRPLT